MKKENPCKDCIEPRRYVGCHAKCKEYLAWKKHNDKRNDKIRQVKNKSYIYRKYY